MEITWLAYELRPEPVPLKNRSVEETRAAWQQSVLPLAEELEMPMNPPGVSVRSRLAHEAHAYAKTEGKGEAMHSALFTAFFVDGRDIGDKDVLVEIGEAVGLSGSALRDALDSRRFEEQIVAEETAAAEANISGVPSFIAGSYLIPGLVPAEQLERLLEAAAKD